MKFILRGDMLTALHQKNNKGAGCTFALEFVKVNRLQKTGGEIVAIQNAVLYKNREAAPRHRYQSLTTKRHRDNWQKSRISILCLQTQRVYTVYKKLIISVNNITVYP